MPPDEISAYLNRLADEAPQRAAELRAVAARLQHPPQTVGAALRRIAGAEDAVRDVMEELRHALAARERIARHAIRYRAAARARADKAAEDRLADIAWLVQAPVDDALPAVVSDEIHKRGARVVRLERAIRGALRLNAAGCNDWPHLLAAALDPDK